jgi:hypothetical protein
MKKCTSTRNLLNTGTYLTDSHVADPVFGVQNLCHFFNFHSQILYGNKYFSPNKIFPTKKPYLYKG